MLDFVTPRSELQVDVLPLTMKEVAQQAYDFLKAQGRRSTFDRHHCAYRGDNGTRCAIGYFMTDEEYSSEMEDKKVTFIKIPSKLKFCSKEFLLELQLSHDHVSSVIFLHDLKKQFERLSERFNLNLNL